MSGSDKMDSLEFSPIGYFKSQHKYKYDAPRQSVEDETKVYGKVVLEPGLSLDQGIKGLEGFERIWLIYKFHKNTNWKPVTNTPRATDKQGVFATRSPYRPNPIGMSCVKLERIGSNYLLVSGYDLLDGTPILDIKPYIPACDKFNVVNKSWIEEEEAKIISFSEAADKQLSWLEDNGLKSLRGFIVDQLKRDPVNKNKKRVRIISESKYELSYRTWRVEFVFNEDSNSCEATKISSGYSEQDFLDNVDKYEDKKLHRKFIEEFVRGGDAL